MLESAVVRGSGGNYSLVAADCGKALIFDTTNAPTTIIMNEYPTDTSMWLGFQCDIYNLGNRDITFSILSGVTITPGGHGHIHFILSGGRRWQVVTGGAGPETDPIFSNSPAGSITSQDKTEWSSGYDHSLTTHAPTNAQKNSDITKDEIESKLTGEITSHTHAGGGAESDPVFVTSPAHGIQTADISKWENAYTHSQSAHAPIDAQKNSDILKSEIEAKLIGTITSHTHEGITPAAMYARDLLTRFEPVTNGDPYNTELVFYNGDVVMVEVPNVVSS